MSVGQDAIILGHTWLAEHNPDINWHTGEVKMTHCPEYCGLTKGQDSPKATALTSPIRVEQNDSEQVNSTSTVFFTCSHHFCPFHHQRHFLNSVFFIVTTVIITCNTLIVITQEVIDQGSEHLPASQAWEQPKNPLPGESQTPCLAL